MVYAQAKDQEELRQLLDSLKSSDVISVQVTLDTLYCSSSSVTMIALSKNVINIFGTICCCCPRDENPCLNCCHQRMRKSQITAMLLVNNAIIGNFQHKKASLSSRASQEKEARPKPLLLNMEDQVWIKSNCFIFWPHTAVHCHSCHLCLQGLTGERRYTKSPPKTRSSIFSSKPYNASHYVPSFTSKVGFDNRRQTIMF